MKKITQTQTNEAVRKYLKDVGVDGHTILSPTYLVKMGFEQSFVQRYAVVHVAGQDLKERIFDNIGQPLRQLKGVYALDFLYAVARDVGADLTTAQSKMGRGSQARELVAAVNLAMA